jgi:signal transduction histidine kinase
MRQSEWTARLEADRVRQQEERHDADVVNVAAKQHTIRYISHEIRTPIGICNTSISLVLDELKQRNETRDADIVDLLEDSLHGCKSAMTILSDMLTHEAIEAGKYTITPLTLPAVETVESIVKNIKSVGNAKNVRLVLDNLLNEEDCASLVIQVDQPKLEQAFLNIASNSVKFSPENSELRVSISLTKSPQVINDGQHNDGVIALSTPPSSNQDLAYAGVLTISFVDSGVGIDPSDLDRVFGEFTQFNSSLLQGGGGSGLGLFITRNIMKCHNGTIDVYSDGIGRGTRFELKLASYKSINSTSNAHEHVIQLAESMDDEATGNIMKYYLTFSFTYINLIQI